MYVVTDKELFLNRENEPQSCVDDFEVRPIKRF